MKNLAIKAMTLCVALGLYSCENTENEIQTEPQEVEFSIDYSFSSGSMSRATNDEIYTKFFEDHIKTRILTPKGFSLTFTNAKTTQKTEVAGVWSNKSMVRLLEGKYGVSGTSKDTGGYIYVRDSLALTFNDSIEISSKTTNINIKAGYACSLVFFDEKDTKSVQYYSSEPYGTAQKTENLKCLDGYFFGFVKEFSNSEYAYFIITRKNGNVIKIHTKNLNLENGKYYFFNDMTGGFDLEPMTPGN